MTDRDDDLRRYGYVLLWVVFALGFVGGWCAAMVMR